MQIPIPDDWGGDDWTCYNIAWPNSVLWQGLLVGFVTQPARGRFWDAKSGSIAAVQSVGREIFQRNYPFVACAGDIPDEGLIRVEDCPTCGGGMLIVESEEMGQVVTEVRIEGGKLIVEYGPCCVREFDLTLNAITPLVEDDVDAENWPEQQEFSACGKAGALIDAIWLVGNECYDEIDNFPWQWVGHVKEDVPGMELSSGYITMSVLDAQVLALAEVTRSEVFSDEAKQGLICGALGHFGDDYDTPSNLKSICHGLIQSAYGLDFMRISFFGAVIEAIGENDLRNAALAGATDTERDCACPSVGMGKVQWTTYVEELTTLANAQDGEMTTVISDNNRCLEIDWSGTSSSGSTDNTTIFGCATLEPVTEVVLRLQGDSMPTANWDPDCDPQVLSNVQVGTWDVGPDDVQKTYGADYVDVTFTWNDPEYLTRWGYYDNVSARHCPQSPDHPFQDDWTVTVLSAT